MIPDVGVVFVVASIEMPNGDTLELRSVGPKGLLLYSLPHSILCA